MKNIQADIAIKCLRRLLAPVVSFCIRHSLTTADLLRQVKALFVELGIQEIESQGKTWNISRLSVLTGLRRQEVLKFKDNPPLESAPSGLLTRVIGRWVTDQKYLDQQGSPRILTATGGESEFHELVMQISTDVSPRSVLAELLRKEIVTQDDLGIKLNFKAYIPQGDVVESFNLLQMDLDDLIRVVEENTFSEDKTKQQHATTEYTNIDRNKEAEIKEGLLKLGGDFHQNVREFLHRYDLDSDPKNTERIDMYNLRVIFGTFSRVSDLKTNAKKK